MKSLKSIKPLSKIDILFDRNAAIEQKITFRKRYIIVLLILYLYSISSFAQQKLAVQITGVNDEAKKNILAVLDINAVDATSIDSIKNFYATAPDSIKEALEPFGYFKATINTSLIHQPSLWIAKFHIHPGRPLTIQTVDLKVEGQGVADLVLKKTIERLSLKENQIFTAQDYTDSKKKLLKTALARGYFDAKFTTTALTIDLQHYNVAIVIHLNTGIRYRFGPLLFSNTPFDNDFLARFAPFSRHEYYSEGKIRDFQEALNSGNYFKEVFVSPDTSQKFNQEVPISVSLKPLPLRQYKLGFGYGTDTGVRGVAGFEWRRVTKSGQQFKAETQISEISRDLKVDYIIPGRKPATDQYILSADITQENQALGESDVEKIIGSYITNIQDWQQTINLTLQHEYYRLEDNPYQSQILLYPSIDWSKTSQDDLLRPSKGHSIHLKLLAAPKVFDNTPFFQTQLSLKTIYPMFQTNRLLWRGDISYTQINDINNLPLSFQFLAGGAQRVRGYHYNAIGPGSTSLVGSIEYRHQVIKDWYLAAFTDAGSVSNSFGSDFQKGIGFGVVWQSILGTLELTAAQAQDLANKPVAIQFRMGADL